MISQVIHHAQTQEPQHLKDLFELLRIPSISTLPEHKPDCLKAAHWLTRYMKRIGLDHVQLVKTSGNPIVYADWLHAPGKPTVLIYGHYDVQPADPLNEWKSLPFEPTIRGNRLYGRGTSDNKCQHFIFLAAAASYLSVHKKLPLNIKFAIEGAEETGSQHFDIALKSNQRLFDHHAAIIADMGMANSTTPTIFYGLRGIVYTEITITGPKQDLHSGGYGGIVDNPANVLVSILARLKDKSHQVTIPGFYDKILPVTPQERQVLATYPRTQREVKHITGVTKLITEKGYTFIEQTKIRPSLDINGIYSGFAGKGSKTIIPATATAKVSMRLVPNQDPRQIFKKFKNFILRHTPNTVKAKIELLAAEPPVLVDYKSREIEAVIHAFKAVFKNKSVFNRGGGSIPAAAHLFSLYKKPLIITGFAPLDNNAHSPNENFYLPNFGKGIAAAIRIFHQLSA